MTRCGPPGNQHGQALTEMVVLAAVLLPLLLLVSTLAKYMHLKQRLQQASRSVAWEATVVRDHEWNRLDAAGQRQRVLDRHLGSALAPIQTQLPNSSESARVEGAMFNTFSGRPLLERRDVDVLRYRNEPAAALASIIEASGRLVEKLPGEFPPNRNGLITAKVVFRPRNLRNSTGEPARFLEPLDAIDLQLSSQHALLADTWSAAGNGLQGQPSHGRRRSVDSQVRTLVPSSNLRPISQVLDRLRFLEILPIIGVPARLRPGYIQPDIVPIDRLEPYRHR
ncbi:TadE/TadG family type IV pilus assembly protein [Lysobacter sp. GCM10012299]|uniref:TadE/TadG family type IV pilus assembly protein n=1 Tax=Lysobacter sp. GCM10012299 TaxID=3317333 RepID=UPI00360630E9